MRTPYFPSACETSTSNTKGHIDSEEKRPDESPVLVADVTAGHFVSEEKRPSGSGAWRQGTLRTIHLYVAIIEIKKKKRFDTLTPSCDSNPNNNIRPEVRTPYFPSACETSTSNTTGHIDSEEKRPDDSPILVADVTAGHFVSEEKRPSGSGAWRQGTLRTTLRIWCLRSV